MEDNKETNMKEDTLQNKKVEPKKEKKKLTKKKKIIISVLVVLLIVSCVALALVVGNKKLSGKNNDKKESTTSKIEVKDSLYKMSGNGLEDFDLYFLQLENEAKNKIYSPLSIKYALAMLGEGSDGYSKAQIDSLVGGYKAKKYTNSENMSFANALFVRDSYKENIKDDYIDKLSSKYNAEVVYDSFKSADKINTWVSDKTFKMVDKLFSNAPNEDFILINALAIDMEWENKIQSLYKTYNVRYDHEDYNLWIPALADQIGYSPLDFENMDKQAKSVLVGASANRYDIVSELGEENIRKTVGEEYKKWLAEGACGNPEKEPDVETYLDTYIKEISTGYKQVSSSTDFYFYDNEEIKAFAKDLKEYNGMTLQYVGIMPKKEELKNYIEQTNAKEVNTIINNLKGIELNSFEEGKVTKIQGQIPMFKFDYELNLQDDLKELGIKDVFDKEKADLSKITSEQAFVSKAVHKANIEFSNDGIKAAAAVAIGGSGATGCGFEYLYDVPIKEINISFDKPYFFIIRDKDSGEVWFTGTVYEPVEYVENDEYAY